MCLLAAKAIACASVASARDLTASGGAEDPAALALVEAVCPASKRSSLNFLLISVMLPYSIPSLPFNSFAKRKRTRRTWNFPKDKAFFFSCKPLCSTAAHAASMIFSAFSISGSTFFCFSLSKSGCFGAVTCAAHKATLRNGKVVVGNFQSAYASEWQKSSPMMTLAPYERPADYNIHCCQWEVCVNQSWQRACNG